MSRSSPRFQKSRTRIYRSSWGPCAWIPLLALSYPAIIEPLIYLAFPPAPGLEGLLASRIENRIFWPALALVAILAAAQNRTNLNRLVIPPNIASLFAYVAFAGLSVAWSFNLSLSFIRFIQEILVLIAIIVPALLAPRNADIQRGVFLCFALATAVNILLIPGGYVSIAQYGAALVEIGYQGYFTGKNLLGEFAAVTCLLSIYEILIGGRRTFFGLTVGALACVLLFLSNSKTALALAVVSPLLAGVLVSTYRKFRVSPAIVVSVITLIIFLFCKLTDFNTGRIAYILTGDSSFTGRTTIWNFAETEIARNPILGWGYQSFWLAGPDAPSIVDAPGWVKLMPNAHNGYYDTMLELGYVGLIFLSIFLITNLYVIGSVAKRDGRKAWLLLSIALFVLLYNFLETLWLRAFDLSWTVFVFVAVEAARHWQPSPAVVSPDRTISTQRFRSRWRLDRA